MKKVNKRGGFSDRNAIKSQNIEIQLKDFDERTRIQLKNMISKLYDATYEHDLNDWKDEIQQFFRHIFDEVYSVSIDVKRHYEYEDIFDEINETILHGEYDDVLTLVEDIIQYWDNYLIEKEAYDYYDCYNDEYRDASLYQVMNKFFEKEYIGYRFIGGIIVPISDDYEVAAIEEGIACKFDSVKKHFLKASTLLSDRDNPDYENSIKESISAVEAICEVFTGIKGKEATLGNMLKKLESNGIEIHSGLRSAFNILYGYTSDANGIRHAGDIGGKTSTFEEAKFMLVSCCAFVNYLVEISSK